MLASLPMYDRPGNAAAHDALWSAIRDGLRARGIAAPDRLDRTVPHREGWRRADLVLGQVCVRPLLREHRDLVRIGCLDHGLPDTPAGFYRSVFVSRADDPRDPAAEGLRFAYNSPCSHSGWGAAQAWRAARGLPPLPATLRTGGHLASLAALREGRADLACVDLVTLAIDARLGGGPRALHLGPRTAPVPGQTLVTRHPDPAPFREAVRDALAALSGAHRRALGGRALAVPPDAAYAAVPLPADPPAAA
ncbi:phosphonate ABC transporter substrate-binding protein [Hasllibacter halocynthiae]|uniref:Phosphonate ABC transporter substrate-binding protein n=1 Tax=Hasllibacter halocynthiae TaxID=595589 RepID=A0A2T0X720_9RHOB|nr:PhnD/SsuA/transferrin family substrate-binding protein [Hasllibacter halocynthiae]PRY94685.1 phosphonate ABC transporter substrate-binding protein [Hasllibacter halocynthiae]